jgi:CO/xanthine dehydrogenase Mo-binding subunit
VGKAINLAQVDGQIACGVVQGIGFALMEEVELGAGRAVNLIHSRHLIPAFLDAPEIQGLIV